MVDGKMQDLLKQTFALKPRHGQQKKRIGDGKKDTTKTFPQISLLDLSCIPKTKAQVICAHYLPIVSI